MRRILWAAAVLAAAGGCGDGGPVLVPVHGRVTLDGRPLAGKTVKFVPDPGTPGLGAGATTNAEGAYTLLSTKPGATRDTPGTPAGAYRVVVVEPMFPVDLPVQSSDSSEATVAIGLPALSKKKAQEIPPAYSKEDTTPLRVTVPDGGGALNLTLETPAKR
jgi:hypothetical protein